MGAAGNQGQRTDGITDTILIIDMAIHRRPNGNGRAFALLVRRRRVIVKTALSCAFSFALKTTSALASRCLAQRTGLAVITNNASGDDTSGDDDSNDGDSNML
jgi:hypothetical protein